MTTLADMAEEERAECVGMWCEEKDGSMCIYMGADATPEQTGVFAYPASEIPMRVFLNRITPRFDLPRAWQADGTPPAGEWEYDYVGTDGCSMITGEYVDPKPGEEIRRWIGDWEEA